MTSDNDLHLRIIKDLEIDQIQIVLFEGGNYHKPILIINQYNWKRLNSEYNKRLKELND